MMERISVQEGISSQGVSITTYSLKPESVSAVDSTSFLAESLYREVMEENRSSGRYRKVKKLKQLHKGFMSILVTAMLASPTSTLAQSNSQLNSIYQNTNTMTGGGQEITPELVNQWGFTLAVMTVSIGVAIAGSLLALAGMYRMLRKRPESAEWTVDIIKGLVQVLIAIPVVYSLYYLAQIIFQNMPILNGMR